MGDVNESLDFLALLDEVEEDTVSRLVNEMSQTDSSSCEFGSRDALDILSICDSASASNSMASATHAHMTEADSFPAEVDDKEMHVQQNVMALTPSVERGRDKPNYFLAADHAPSQNPAVMNRNYLTNSQAIVHTAGAGENVSARKHGRWQFSKWQREHLDGAFKKNMYPSKWKLTELCTALQVPMHTLRVWFQNRRWRLRKSRGLTGDLHTRGSRAMLPDKDETAAKGCHGSAATTSRMDSHSSALSSGSRSQTSEVSISSPKPLMPSCLPLGTTRSLSSPSLGPILPSPSSSSLYLMSTPHPLFGDLGQSMGEYSWSLPSLTASWALPSTHNWLNGSPLLSTLPFAYSASQWHSCAYSLPVLPPLYPSDMSPPLRQTPTGGISEETSNSSLPYTKSALEKPAPAPTYLFYNKPSHHLAAGHMLPVIMRPMTATTLDCPISNNWSSTVFNNSGLSPGPPRSVTSFTLPRGNEQIQGPQTPGPCSDVAITSSSLMNVETPDETGTNLVSKLNDCMSSRMQYCSHVAAPSTVQSICSCGMCLNSIGAPVWTSSLPYPAERILDPRYSKAMRPSFPSLPTSTFQYIDFQAGSSISPAETARAAQVTMDRDDLFRDRMMPGIKEEFEDVDVLTVHQSAEEEISSTSDYTK